MKPPTPRKPHILLVEDDDWDALAATEAFTASSFAPTLERAEDGVIALERLRRAGAALPDLILLDLNLPRMDGRELLGHIKTDPVLRRIPVIILSTSKAEKDVLRAYDLHANAYVNKPFDPEEYPPLVSAIEQFWLTFNVAARA